METRQANKDIGKLIDELASKDGKVREKARLSLADIGEKTVPPLIEMLSSSNQTQRWEAAKTLGQIGDPKAVPFLIDALGDGDFDFRWLAAEGLIKMGDNVVVPLLQALVKNPDSNLLYDAAHHIFNHLVGGDANIVHHVADHPHSQSEYLKILNPVISAIEGRARQVETPVVAQVALNKLKAAKKG